MRTQYLGITDLDFVLVSSLVESLRRQSQLAYAVILFMIVRELVAGHERVGSGDLIVKSRAHIGAHTRVEYTDHRLVGRSKGPREYDRSFINIAAFRVDLVRELLAQRPAHVAA